MNVWTVVLMALIVLALAAAIWLVLALRRRHKKRQRQADEVRKQQRRDDEERPRYVAWIEQLEAANTDGEVHAAGIEYFNVSADDARRILGSEYLRYKQAHDKYRRASIRRSNSEALAEYLKEADNDTVLIKIATVDEDNVYYDSEIVFGVPSDQLADFFMAYVSRMLDHLRDHLSAQYLRGYFRCMTHQKVLRFIQRHNLSSKIYPEDWDDMVDTACIAPELSLFRNYSQRSPGEVAIMAAAARKSRNSKLAKLVLAYYRHNESYRNAIGDSVQKELNMLVLEHSLSAVNDAIPSASR